MRLAFLRTPKPKFIDHIRWIQLHAIQYTCQRSLISDVCRYTQYTVEVMGSRIFQTKRGMEFLTLYLLTSQSGNGTPCESSLLMTHRWCWAFWEGWASRYEARSRHASSVALQGRGEHRHKNAKSCKSCPTFFGLSVFKGRERVTHTWTPW